MDFSFKKMGQSHSQSFAPVTMQRKKSLRSPFLRRKQRPPLSATFTAPNTLNIETLNINTATVEQLMTLQGITRQIAQSIVDHRLAIGGRFQRVDDLALVSGIGAEKLEKIRPEICVKKKLCGGSINGSIQSSRTPSMDSVVSESQSREQKLILNINTASIFQLQQINGMNQEIAAKVIDYRIKKGPFKSLDDMIKIKGLSHARLGTVRTHLSVNDDDIPKTPRPKHSTISTSTPLRNGFHQNSSGKSIGHRKSLSVPIKMNLNLTNGFTNAPVHDIFELLGAYSHRPIVEEDYRHERNGFSTIRVASWNLDKMCCEKSRNFGVKEVVCRTILENKLSVLCLQEVTEPEALHNICEELNNPSLKRIIEWRENSKNWKYIVNKSCKDNFINGLGFIYDEDFCQLVEEESTEIPLDECFNDDPIQPTAYLAAFRLSDWTCYILNIYLRYFDLLNTNCVLKSVEKHLENRLISENLNKPTITDVFLVAGDFTGTKYPKKNISKSPKFQIDNSFNDSHTTVDIDLQNFGFHSIIEPGSTSFSNKSVLSSCNILCREKLPQKKSEMREAFYKTKSAQSVVREIIKVPSKNEKLTGYCDIVRQGLCHMAIPRGWNWGGPASEYCPVWVEVYRKYNRDVVNNGIRPTIIGSRQNISQSPDSMRINGNFGELNGHLETNGFNTSSDSVFLPNKIDK